jgi:hypothetical protein
MMAMSSPPPAKKMARLRKIFKNLSEFVGIPCYYAWSEEK